MRSALFVVDLIGRNAGVEIECHARGFIDPELDHGKETVRLVRREEGQASAGGQSFAEDHGSHQKDFVTGRPLPAIRRIAYCRGS